ncbi:hypothetical protein [Arthrobacter sp. ISL-95]|uniref:hypothetical protein n=1 Tax=Arthrobacter sp. ISL-95 TaxID=2819116 RepID=UPI001BE8A1E0|nr:hypothetical protein [Arthrobacter sp. ISL-95]MBT2587982.1 hypothetical protein [Arthrobacter sp. ISL-95]
MTADLQEPQEIGGVEWIVDFESEPPQRLVKIEYDAATLMALVDIANYALASRTPQTRENAFAFRDYALRVVRELESRSLIDQEQWKATAEVSE